MKYLLMTHNDLDGATCEIIFRLYFAGKDIHVSCSSIAEMNQRIRVIADTGRLDPTDTIITFADICPEKGLLDQLLDMGYRCYLFDHHPTAAIVDRLEQGSRLSLSGSDSGSSLLRDYLENEGKRFNLTKIKLKRFHAFVDTVRSWDTWEWVKTGNMLAKKLVTLFFMLGSDRFVQLYLSQFLSGKFDDQPVILPEHMFFVDAKLEQQQEIIDSMTPEQVFTRKLFGYNAAIVFSGTGLTFSDGSYQFLRKYPEYDLMVNINPGRRTISYRTIRDGINLGELTSALGGGGHERAAGNPIGADALSKILELLFGGSMTSLTDT